MAVVSPGITIFAFVSILFTQAKGESCFVQLIYIQVISSVYLLTTYSFCVRRAGQGLCNTGDGDMTGVPTSLIGSHGPLIYLVLLTFSLKKVRQIAMV